jgi:outer membrane protein insertion porin family
LDRKETGLGLQVFDRNVYKFADNFTNALGSGSGGRYNQQQTGGALTLSRPFAGSYQAALTLRGENTRTDPLGLNGVNAQIVQDGPLYTVGTTLQHDTRDLVADPVRGSLQNVSVNVGHADLRSPLGASAPEFGSHNFAKSQLDYRLFYSLTGARRPGHPEDDRTSLAFRLLAGGAAGHLPFSEQFFLGGGESLRGYREDRFWGSNLLLGSMELRQPVAPRFKLVAFMDVGEAWGGDYGGLNIGGFSQREVQPHVGAGFGVRVNTPLGALRIDLGFGDEGARTHFGFGTSF